MRTLKKTLSLVLVVAMVLGLCVVGASATNKVDGYEDAGKIGAAYTEAVGVMTGLGIVDGVTDTELRPENTYQRDQAAKIIAYMLLGKNKADSLSCTVAPFEDVPANHWAAGYIAFCKEQGIIDGVTETTFNPTGTLTGFQWAKMLLCAVGFGVNGEFEGDSWSLNTSKVAHTVDLFAGDLAGADHVALQRQQAMLYAFNALTNVDVVVYSAALGDYIEWYSGFVGGRFTYTGTLGENVYSLYNVTGTIINNEAMGNGTTVVDPLTGDDVKVAAKTGLDMMWHVAKVWYVKGSSNTGVYVKDLATVKNSSCGEMAKTPTGYTDKAIGNPITDTAYEKSLVDNPAGYTDYAVTTYAYLSKIGNSSTAAKTTYIGTDPVKNDYIKTDISDIAKNVTVIVIRPSDKAFHVFATSATSGAVKGISSKGVITLTDGTTIAPSNLGKNDQDRANSIARIKTVLAGDRHETPTYYFTLDTHGHYITLTNTPFMTVAYFTGARAYTGGTNDWWPDATYKAQFVDIETGEIEEIPVTKDWVDNVVVDNVVKNGYYDITDELYGEKTYEPKPVFTNYADTYGLKYGYVGEETFSVNTPAANRIIDLGVDGEEVRYDNTTVFYVANYNGSKLVVDKYVGVDALVAGYAAKHNTTVSAVTFDNAAITYSKTTAGNKVALTVFAYDTAVASGEYVFFPTTTTWSAMYDSYIEVDGYLNGTSKTGVFKFDKDDFGTSDKLERGFYEYSVDESGDYTYRRLTTQEFAYEKSALDITKDNSGNVFFGKTPVSGDCLVVDTREDLDELEIDEIDSLDLLVSENVWNDKEQYGDFAVAYVPYPAKEITVIYVVDFNLGLAEFSMADALASSGWNVTEKAYEDETVTINSAALKALADNTKVDVAFSIKHEGISSAATTGTVEDALVKDGKLVIDVDAFTGNVYGVYEVEITGVTYDVTVTNKQTEFGACYLNPAPGDTSEGVTLDDDHNTITVKVGDKIRLCVFRDDVADNLEATIYLTGADNQNITFQGSKATKYGWSDADGFVPTSNTLVIEKVTAKYTITLGVNDTSDPATLFNFAGGNSMYDKIVVEGVPGSKIFFQVQASNETTSTGNLKFVVYNNNGSVADTTLYSNETVATATNRVFTFDDLVPTANAFNLREYEFTDEPLAPQP